MTLRPLTRVMCARPFVLRRIRRMHTLPRASQAQTPLTCAARVGHTACVEALLAAGANKDQADRRVSGANFFVL